jgi:hypothetical protein
LLEIGRDFKIGKLNHKLLDLFNYSLPCNKNCPNEYWNALSCYHDPVRQMVIVKYVMKIIDPKLHVMAADSFDLVTNNRKWQTNAMSLNI